MGTPQHPQISALASDQILGPEHHRFQLIEALGDGLLGALWQARDLSTTTSTTVTLQILTPALASDTAVVNAFKKQLTLNKALEHPHIAASYGYFLDRSGLLFSAHEALDGLTLAQLIEKGRLRKLPPKQRRSLLGQLAQALDAGYQKLRQPHGALEPSQVFINRQGGVKLFGFAGRDCLLAASRHRPDIDTALAAYRPPEAALPGRLTAGADLYSLAVIAHRILGGSLPWTAADTDLEPSRLVRPSKITAAQWPVLQEALTTDPQQRPTSAVAWFRRFYSAETQPAPTRSADTAPLDTAAAHAEAPAESTGVALSQRLRNVWNERLRRLLPVLRKAPSAADALDAAKSLPQRTGNRILGIALFAVGLALGFWLGLRVSQPQLDTSERQLRQLARHSAELETALQALQASQDAEHAVPTERPDTAQTDTASGAAPIPAPAFPQAPDIASQPFHDQLLSGGFGPDMLQLPQGAFLMGSDAREADDNERPVRRIQIERAVALAVHEVTFEEYDRFADASGRRRPDDNGWGRGRQPVINVSWQDASAYARWLADQSGQPYRLPSEAEWEYAARAGTSTPFWWGTELGSGHAVCDACGTEWDGLRPAPAGSLAANPWGLYNLNGNVSEWVQDCYVDNLKDVPDDGTAHREPGCRNRVLRGGSWFEIGRLVRASSRYRHPPDSRRSSWGFRVAVDLPQQDAEASVHR